MRKQLSLIILAVGLAGMVGACGDDDDTSGSASGSGSGSGVSADEPTGESVATITAADIAYDPTELTVGEAEGGEDADIVVPDEPGTYDFYCRYHPDQMTGTLTVE